MCGGGFRDTEGRGSSETGHFGRHRIGGVTVCLECGSEISRCPTENRGSSSCYSMKMKITYTNCCSSMMKITSKLSLLYRRKLMIKINYHNVIKLRSVYHEVLPQGPCNGCITPRWVYCDASPPCRCIVMHFLVVGVS